MKKIASILLAVVMLATMLCVFAVPASAEGETESAEAEIVTKPESATWLVDEGDNHVWWQIDNGTLTVGGKGAMPDFYNVENQPWNYAVENIIAIEIASGVTSIGDNAFCACQSLKSVTIPFGVTSIGEYAFFSCQSLKSVTIPFGVTTIGNAAFNKCASLESVTIPESVTSIGNSMFCDCTGLTSITIPSSVQSIGIRAFDHCTSLTSITILSGVKDIGSTMFSNCTNLTSIIIPSSVQSIGENAFYSCQSLKSATIPFGVTSIGSFAFNKCASLESVSLPSSVQTIGTNVNSGCSNLTSLTLKAKNPPTWNNIQGLFSPSPKLTIYIPDGMSQNYRKTIGWSSPISQEKVKEAYVVDDQPGENGTIMLDKDCFPTSTYTAANATVTVTVMPAAGYLLKADSLTVSDENGTAIALTKDETDPMKYTFTMPCSNVTVKAEFEECEHSESEWVVEAEATCVIDGYRVNKCKACGKVLEAEVIPATGEHTFDTSKWHYDATYHWHAAVCCDTEEVLDKKEHTYNFFGFGNTCTVCGYVKDGAVTGSTLSDGNVWIIVAVAVLAVTAVVVIVVVRKKKKNAGN